MLKLRKPFLQNIQLHIRQDLLQSLWDKYVPASSPEYEQIQLVYLSGETGQEEGQPRQIQLLISLLLKNRMLQMGEEKYPSSLAFGIRRMETSLKRVEKYCLTQLKGRDFTMFRSVEQYMTLLEQEQTESRRYEGWQREHQETEQKLEEYRLLSIFSRRVREFLEEHSKQMTGAPERELLASLSETEYRRLAETSIWQRREAVIAYLKTCGGVQAGRMTERLKEETALCRSLIRKTGLAETDRKERALTEERELRERTARDRFAKLKFAGKKYARLKTGNPETPEKSEKPERDEAAFRKVLKPAAGQTEGDRLSDLAKLFEQKEFLLFYRQVVEPEQEPEQEDSPLTVWKKSREEMISYLDRVALRLEHKRTEAAMSDIPEAKVLQQVREQADMLFPEQMRHLEEEQVREWNRNFREQISSMVEEEPFTVLADVTKDWEEPSQLVQKLEDTGERWKEQLRQREERMFEKYREQYQGVLQEETFRIRYQEKAGQEGLTEEEIQNICTWSRLLLETSVYGIPEEKMESSEEREPAPIIPAKEGEYEKELVYLMEQVSRRIEGWNVYEKEPVPVQRRSSYQVNQTEEQREGLEKLLLHLHGMEEEQKGEFVSRLAEAVLLWQQAAGMEQSSGTASGDSISDWRQETVPASAEQEAMFRFVEENFIKQQKEYPDSDSQTEEEIHRICTYGKIILDSVSLEYRPAQEEYRAAQEEQRPAQEEPYQELVSIIKQINQYMENRAIYGENHILLRKESQIKEPDKEETRRMLTYVRNLNEEQREGFVRRLADAVLLRHQTDVLQKVLTKQKTELSEEQKTELSEKQKTEFSEKFSVMQEQNRETVQAETSAFPSAELQLLQSEETGAAGVAYREMWEWSESLLFHPEQEQEREDGDILSGQWQTENLLSQDMSQEDLQTQLIRRQIEGAKDRNSLQRLLVQMNHQTEDRLHLVYADSQLAMAPIQSLLRHIRTLDEKQYGILLRELSRIAELRWAVYEEQREGRHLSAKGKQTGLLIEENLPDLEKSNTGELSGAAAYPGLVFYIQGYERQRRLRMGMYLRKLAQACGIRYADERENTVRFTDESTGSFPFVKEQQLLDGSSAAIYGRNVRMGQIPEPVPEHGTVLQNRNFPGYGRKTGSQPMPELTYSVNKNMIADQGQSRAELHMQQETIQLKSAQAQLEQKLEEVEAELRKVESAAQAKEDVNVFAEQVKKRLYEELHVEKLRRGLV